MLVLHGVDGYVCGRARGAGGGGAAGGVIDGDDGCGCCCGSADCVCDYFSGALDGGGSGGLCGCGARN